ncbi:hypothetical protein DFP73DRAFT_586231 [Morchella snyderi]|nr:hypothetical protein DFP73DRAFT_586231 [Morchella snyderi]
MSRTTWGREKRGRGGKLGGHISLMAALLQLQSDTFVPPIQVDDGPRIWFNLELAMGEIGYVDRYSVNTWSSSSQKRIFHVSCCFRIEIFVSVLYLQAEAAKIPRMTILFEFKLTPRSRSFVHTACHISRVLYCVVWRSRSIQNNEHEQQQPAYGEELQMLCVCLSPSVGHEDRRISETARAASSARKKRFDQQRSG